jgi:hypothetical protein
MTTPEIPPASKTPAVPTASGTPAVVTTAPKRSRAPEVIALLLVILGGIALPVGFFGGILAALNSGGNGPGGYIILFIAGIVAIVIGFIIGLVSLIRGPHRILSAFPVIIPLIPVITVIAAVSSARH